MCRAKRAGTHLAQRQFASNHDNGKRIAKTMSKTKTIHCIVVRVSLSWPKNYSETTLENFFVTVNKMASRNDIRNGRGSLRQKRQLDIIPEPMNKLICSWMTCTGVSCCMLWFIMACTFAGLFGWQFSLEKSTSTINCPGYSYVEHSPTHAPTHINKLNFIPNGADEVCVRTQENIASTMSLIQMTCEFPAILDLSSTDVCHTTDLEYKDGVATYKMCDDVECTMQFTSSTSSLANFDPPSTQAFNTVDQEADTVPLVILADTSRINKHALTPSSVDENKCRQGLNLKNTQHLIKVDATYNAHFNLPSAEESFSTAYHMSNSNTCLLQYTNNANNIFAQTKMIFSL